jgi:hypothetical protein
MSDHICINKKMTTDWLLYVNNGINFNNSSISNTWGIKSWTSSGKSIKNSAKVGDRLWFVKSGSNGLLVAVATFVEFKNREVGPLIAVTQTNEELGWITGSGDWDVEVHYKDLYNITNCELYSELNGSAPIRRYNDKCKINLPLEYPNIVRYSKVTRKM